MVQKQLLKVILAPVVMALVLTMLPNSTMLLLAAESENDGPNAVPQSDDFDSCVLREDLWTFTDPLGDSVLTVDGSVISIEMAAGAEHDLWEGKNNAPRLMQPVTNENFAVDVKFESAVEQKFQTQGIIIEQDRDNFLRFDFYHDGTNIILFAAGFTDGAVIDPPYTNKTITDAPASPAGYYMRVERDGNRWIQRYSFTGNDGDWSTVQAIEHTLTTTQVGIFGGNVAAAGQQAPAHTVIADYFFNSAEPISPEDDNVVETLMVSIEGEGTVSPEPGEYECGEQELVATPEEGWVFTGWTGDVDGSTNPATLVLDGARAVTATFAPIPSGNSALYLPLTLR